MKGLRVAAALAGLAVLAATPTAAAVRPMGRSQAAVTVRGQSAEAARTAAGRAARIALMRRTTARFHDIATAEAAGYVPFTDVHGVSCISEPGMGGMGVHYVNPKLIADPAIRPGAPEALVYAPERDGTLRLAALEYLVPKAAWDATHSKGPRLFAGRAFDLTAAPDRYGLPTFYSEHVWVWKSNPAGLLAMWNPTVHCARA